MSNPSPLPVPESQVPRSSIADAATSPQRTHPATPWVRMIVAGPVGFFAVFFAMRNVIQEEGISFVAIVGITIVVLILIWVLIYVSWQKLTFWFDGDGDLRVASGIFTRKERRLQLSRLQGVDIVQPLAARVAGMASVNIEVAGSGDSRVTLSYLSLSEAEALRAEVIARSAGVASDSGPAPEEPLVRVPPKDLFWSLMLRGSTVVLLALTAFLVFVVVSTSGIGGLLILATGGIPLLLVVTEFTQYYNFTVAKSPDGLRLKSGLFQTKAQTIPPGRVQAVEFVQSWLWRKKGWVRVRLNVAGLQSADDGNSNTETVLLPVAPHDVAQSVVAYVLPGVDPRAVELTPVPARAGKRAWIQSEQLGVGFDDEVFVTKRGRFVSRMVVVPHARTQSVRVTQGPWERSLDLATMHVDSPPGPVEIVALYRDAGEARQLAEDQNRRSLAAARSDTSTRWMHIDQPANPTATPQGEDSSEEPDSD